MSRCFPFPPPGYTLSRASSESLIESIKLQKEKEKKAKEQRKEEKRREKKEKKREKKEKRKDRKEKSKHSKSDIAKTQSVEFSGKTKDEFPQKGREANTELLERSNLTEEHGQPICLHAAPSTSSDSTENSHKRKRQSSPADVSRGHAGNVIRIRLGSKKQSDSSVLTDEHKICSTSGRAEFPTRNDNDNGFKDGRENSSYYILDRVSNDGRFSLKVKREKEPICSTSLSIQAVAPAGTKPPPIPKTQGAPMHKDELRYKNLIEDWVPPQLVADGCDDSDLDWLFKGKNKDERPEKRQRPFSDGISCSSSSSLWRPQAQYLREVDVYALPFTVPF